MSIDVEPNDNKVNASPTKLFFIDMLIRDVDLLDAVTDLVDNSVDGAKELRNEGSFEGLAIDIIVNGDKFEIKDNCGGIRVDHARDYAFRFGRPGQAPQVKSSVGQFGVGMKRSFFKLGTKFMVHSRSLDSEFILEVDVNEWKKDDDNWTFDLSLVDEHKSPPQGNESAGTHIEVNPLHPEVAARLALANFEKDLVRALESKHTVTMERNLVMKVNGKSLNGHIIRLLSSDSIRPALREYVFFETEENPLHIRLYCGIFEDKTAEASGWHIFCNGRLIIEGDNTSNTGWGEDGELSTKIPRWHPQYSRFRGYAFLDSEDASRMPWNTTKSGIDFDSEIYQKIKIDMTEMMRPVVDFLNKLKDERQENKADRTRGPLSRMIREATPTVLATLRPSRVFEFTAPAKSEAPKSTSIQYSMPEDDVDLVKESLNVRSAREAGIETFKYYLHKECGR